MKLNSILLFVGLSFSGIGQEDTELYLDAESEQESTFERHMEVGADVAFSASTFGGNAGLGLKLAIVNLEQLAFGPSVRLSYTYFKQNGLSSSSMVYGGGAFVHGRFFNYLFAGLEVEILKTPFINGQVATNGGKWIPTALLGGGFSHAFGERQFFRLQAGVMYDVLNNPNSPLRYGYFMKKENGTLIPVLYRIGFYFTL
jgi:hypothetical protein